MAQVFNEPISVNIGVILDMDTWVGRMTNSCIFMAVNDFYSTHHNYTTRLVPHIRDSKGDVLDAASAALDLLTNVRVQAIIGPETSEQAGFIANLGDKTHVPIISSTITSPVFSNRSQYFVQTMINDSFQVKPLVAFIEAFRWKEVVLIHEESDYGNGIIPYLTYDLQKSNIMVSDISAIPLKATDGMIYSELSELLLGQTRVFIVHMSLSLGSLLFIKAKEMGMMDQGFVWIITDGLASQLECMDSSVIKSVQGVVGIKSYIPQTEELNAFTDKWKKYEKQENPDTDRANTSIYGLQAYDTMWALAMAVERVMHNLNSSTPGKQVITRFKGLGKLDIRAKGSQLLKTFVKMKFKGLSGEFNLINEQLQPPGYQIVNVIGKGEREIGFWTSTCGISRQLQVIKKKKNCTYINELGPIIWPGEPLGTPKGWTVPNNKIFKVGVPMSSQFEEFASAQKDPQTDKFVGRGFSIDVFLAVVNMLPFSMPYQLVPIRVTRPGDEDSLINEVILKNVDVLVAATSIQLKQSFYVDFSTPYTDLGVSMIVPAPIDKRKNGWVFLKPFTTNLWLVTIATFIFTVTVVGILEHQINTEFWKKPKIRLSTVFWFSLSTSIHRERGQSNMSKLVVVVWIIVLFVLTSSYTASLSSLLTVQQLTTTTISGLKRNNDYLGYRRGSFVLDLLKRWYFDESKLKALDSLEEYREALSKGSGNGGVAAIVDEVPYVNLFLSKHCERYTSVGPIYSSDGFGFVFQKGSFLTSEFSQAISKLKGQGDIDHIGSKWSRLQSSCENMTITTPSNTLSLDSFWVLFLFTVTASSIAAFLHIILAFYKNYQRRVAQQSTTNNIDDVVHQSYSNTRPLSNQEMTPRIDDEQAGTVYTLVCAGQYQTICVTHIILDIIMCIRYQTLANVISTVTASCSMMNLPSN
ncbi:hypothetical protein AQUCO_00500092v1 [Aquilegia coerulea]|uniref:Glutamate receptor n=1 Tax=Aquilegia coerulea TaxID=218851 RepID=A0A2G5EQA2_AQUCA|nr:hypothetical protein AQUCO_00500092v1 [Aquilegia coerulea]